jgi:putative phosphoesterase
MRIGLISDTHGLLRPEVPSALSGVQLILHAGDVGGSAILQALRQLAPVRAVYGNVDASENPDLASAIDLTVDDVTIHVSHGHELGRPTPAALLKSHAADVIVYGHTHRALIHREGSRLVINPGAAGPRRFDIKPSVGILEIEKRDVRVEIVTLSR